MIPSPKPAPVPAFGEEILSFQAAPAEELDDLQPAELDGQLLNSVQPAGTDGLLLDSEQPLEADGVQPADPDGLLMDNLQSAEADGLLTDGLLIEDLEDLDDLLELEEEPEAVTEAADGLEDLFAEASDPEELLSEDEGSEDGASEDFPAEIAQEDLGGEYDADSEELFADEDEATLLAASAMPLTLVGDAIQVSYIDGSDKKMTAFQVKNTSSETLEHVVLLDSTSISYTDEWGDDASVLPYRVMDNDPAYSQYLDDRTWIKRNLDFSIPAGQTVTLMLESSCSMLLPGDYGHFIRFGNYDDNTFYSEQIPVSLHVYAPAASLSFADRNPNDIYNPWSAVNSIDLGTLNLETLDGYNDEFVVRKDFYYVNTSSTTDPVTCGGPDVTIVSTDFEITSGNEDGVMLSHAQSN